MPYTDLAGGRMSPVSCFLKTFTEWDSRISGSSVSHSDKQFGLKVDLNLSVLARICPVAARLRRL